MANTSKMDMKAKQEWAQMLFLEGHTQKAIAAKVGVTEKTIGRWVHDNDWEHLLRFEQNNHKRTLSNLYGYLSVLQKAINERPEEQRYPTPPEADTLMKVTAAINRLKEETTLHDVSVIGKEFTLFVQQQSPADANVVATWYDRFVKYKIKTRS